MAGWEMRGAVSQRQVRSGKTGRGKAGMVESGATSRCSERYGMAGVDRIAQPQRVEEANA